MSELLEQIRSRDEQLEISSKRLDTAEAEKTQLLREIEVINGKIEKLEKTKNDKIKNEEFHVEDLQIKLDAYRDREKLLVSEMEDLKKRTSTVNFPVSKSYSFGGNFKNVPEDPQDKAVYFFRKLLRAESYRKALIWQKRYLSLLIFSYQESELLSLGRLARMSGGRRMLISDIPRPEGRNVQFRVVVHLIISISRMKFLVRRWKKTKKTARKAWSGEPGQLTQSSSSVRLSTEERDEPGLSPV